MGESCGDGEGGWGILAGWGTYLYLPLPGLLGAYLHLHGLPHTHLPLPGSDVMFLAPIPPCSPDSHQ